MEKMQSFDMDLDRLKEIAESNSNIVIYGAGILGQGLYFLMDRMGYTDQILGFAVSPYTDHLNSYMGKQIRCIDKYDLSSVYVLIAVKRQYLDAIIKNVDNKAKWSYVGVATLKEMFTSVENVVEKCYLDKLPQVNLSDEEFVTFCIRQVRRTQLDFEVSIVDHCNLNCQCCNHFSPIAQENYLDVNLFEKDICRMEELTKGDVGRLWLIGGEPLLHPSLIEILFIARKYFPQTHITLNTNGILLLKQSEEFWKALRETETELTITKYPVSVDYDIINKKIEHEQVKYAYTLSSQVLKTTYHLPLDLEGRQDMIESYMKCWHANECIVLREGRIYTCPIAAHAHHFNQYFGKHLNVGDDNSISIYEVKSVSEIIDFLKKPIPFCRHCDISGYTYDLPWKISRKEIVEWT